jgi:hypothetical protein
MSRANTANVGIFPASRATKTLKKHIEFGPSQLFE